MPCIIPYQAVPGLIPRPSEGCPEKTTGCYAPGCPATCYCEDHCSWQRCYLSHPPMDCLDDIDGYWFRKKKSDPWVAKFHGNSNFIYIHNKINAVNKITNCYLTNRDHIIMVNSWGWKDGLYRRRIVFRWKFQAISNSRRL